MTDPNDPNENETPMMTDSNEEGLPRVRRFAD